MRDLRSLKGVSKLEGVHPQLTACVVLLANSVNMSPDTVITVEQGFIPVKFAKDRLPPYTAYHHSGCGVKLLLSRYQENGSLAPILGRGKYYAIYRELEFFASRVGAGMAWSGHMSKCPSYRHYELIPSM